MDFFSKIGETLTEAGRDVSQKAKDLTGTAKLNLDIKAKEDYINKQYMALGKQYYELHQNNAQESFPEMALIREAKEEIARMEAELREIKGEKMCPSCEAILKGEDKFCPSCGAKLEDENSF